jgi:hypothetical protein
MFVFLFFLRAVAVALKEDWLAEDIQGLILFYGGLLVGQVIFGIIVFALVKNLVAAGPGGHNPEVATGLGWVIRIVTWIIGVLYLLAFAWYVRVVFRTRQVVDARVRG